MKKNVDLYLHSIMGVRSYSRFGARLGRAPDLRLWCWGSIPPGSTNRQKKNPVLSDGVQFPTRSAPDLRLASILHFRRCFVNIFSHIFLRYCVNIAATHFILIHHVPQNLERHASMRLPEVPLLAIHKKKRSIRHDSNSQKVGDLPHNHL